MNKSVTLNPDFISDYQEGIKIMSRQEFVNYVKEMEDGQTTDLYILADKENRQTEYNIAIRKEKWNNSTYYLLGGYGYRITTINAEPEITDEDLPAEINNALDYFDIGEQLGVVIVTFPDYSARQLYRQVQDALKLGCKFLQGYRNKEEMLKALDGQIYAITDSNGEFLCDILESDFIHLQNDLTIVDTTSMPQGVYHSDWILKNDNDRNKVLSQRLVVIFTDDLEQ